MEGEMIKAQIYLIFGPKSGPYNCPFFCTNIEIYVHSGNFWYEQDRRLLHTIVWGEAKSQRPKGTPRKSKSKCLGPWGLLTSSARIKVSKQREWWGWKSLAGSGRRQSGPRPPRGPWGALSPVFRLNQQREEHQPVSKKLTFGKLTWAISYVFSSNCKNSHWPT